MIGNFLYCPRNLDEYFSSNLFHFMSYCEKTLFYSETISLIILYVEYKITIVRLPLILHFFSNINNNII